MLGITWHLVIRSCGIRGPRWHSFVGCSATGTYLKEGRGFDIPTRQIGAAQLSMHPSPPLRTIDTLPSHIFLVEAAQVQVATQTAAAADAMDRKRVHLHRER
jgi:hypothetical protein